jgi:queuine tRNA-ribosyltransferase
MIPFTAGTGTIEGILHAPFLLRDLNIEDSFMKTNPPPGNFEILRSEGFARRGRLSLAHGIVETPAFMPVGTYGAVKTLSPPELEMTGSQIILGNTYHLFLRPGLTVLNDFGGLHRFMGWKHPILTDSGGFQIFSLGNLKKVTDEGVSFRSHLNGDSIFLTPQLAAQIQQNIGSDIAMVLDECVALPSPPDVLKLAVDRSFRWAQKFFEVEPRPGQCRFGIVQGGTDPELRRLSLELTLNLPIDGVALGGLSVGESHEEMIATLTSLAPHLPPALPHYLMGVGTPRDLLEAIRCGVDLFDCVLPTRNARNGGFYTDGGLLNIRNQQYQLDRSPISPDCPGLCCQFSRAYLRHLFLGKEMLGCRLATIHNLHYYHRFMSGVRHALASGEFETFYQGMRAKLVRGFPDRRDEIPKGGNE